MAIRTVKKTTIRHKKNRKGEVVETVMQHAEPLTVNIPEWMAIPAAPAPKLKPTTIADAWDAMKEAGELPFSQRHCTVNPYRAEQDKADEKAKAARGCFPRGIGLSYYLTFDPKRRVASDRHQSLDTFIPVLHPLVKTQCPHVYENGNSCVQWMEHSQNIITGVCAHCPTQFDTRHPEHLDLLNSTPKNARRMGHAAQGQIPGTGVGSVYGTEWQIFRYNYFPWLEVLQRRIVIRFRALKKWVFTDF